MSCFSYIIMHDQDGNDSNVYTVIESIQQSFLPPAAKSFHHLVKARNSSRTQGAEAWIAQHYKWGLSQLFDDNHSHAIIIEEDMLLSPGKTMQLMLRVHDFKWLLFRFLVFLWLHSMVTWCGSNVVVRVLMEWQLLSCPRLEPNSTVSVSFADSMYSITNKSTLQKLIFSRAWLDVETKCVVGTQTLLDWVGQLGCGHTQSPHIHNKRTRMHLPGTEQKQEYWCWRGAFGSGVVQPNIRNNDLGNITSKQTMR